MRGKWLAGLLAAETMILIIVSLAAAQADQASWEIDLSFPFAQIGQALRLLSLSGNAGNALATGIYVLICALPVLYLVKRLFQRRSAIEDGILVLMSGFLFFMLYRMINPGLLAGMSPMPRSTDGVPIMKIALSVTFYSLLVAYVIARLTRNSRSSLQKTLRGLQVLLIIISMISVYAIFGTAFFSMLRQIRDATSGRAIQIVLLLIDQIPTALLVIVLFHAASFVDDLRRDAYSRATVNRVKSLARVSSRAIVIMMSAVFAENLFQLVFSRHLPTTAYVVYLPVFPLTAVLFVLFLARYFAQNRAIQNENESFV